MASSSSSVRSRIGGVEEEDVSQLKLGPDFSKAQCLLNSEVAFLLQHRKDHEEGVQASPVFSKTQAYVDRFNRFKNKIALTEVRAILGRNEFEQYEIAALGNLLPESSEEAKALIPSLSRMNDEDLESLLNDLTTYQRYD
eukprot:TRINITY_DN2231_c0_g1_i1.p1 TRINITY_DN2231_c0_g1~~TRINITY_DN2231_c0_g1_i1.p1  ORF type:complete len:140 (+),score=16.79 TRINITY_DN2231_c0_g1_i1:226-645(+)